MRRAAPILACIVLLIASAPLAFGRSKGKAAEPLAAPQLELEGGRKLTYERVFSNEREAKPNRGFWNRVLDVVAGEPWFHGMIAPYSVVTDSHDRIIVTDPAAGGVHVFDFHQQKYKFISRIKDENGLQSPQCVAVDAADNIYVTDSATGKIFVFDTTGKFRRVIGSLKGGEGFFKRVTGIAVDSEAQRIYATDTLRNKIFVLDMQGNVLQTIGSPGTENGEFNYPTELRLHGDELIVVDSMNFRIQVLGRDGTFHYAIGHLGDGQGSFFRPKGVGMDSEGHLYVVEGLSSMVQVFDHEGNLLYYFGQKGSGLGDFLLPTGLFIDRNDRIFVVDSYNGRVQVFHYFGIAKQASGVKR
jgi:DNA-binding beta-propeller fold protein YncE